jgi:hypothetical protein
VSDPHDRAPIDQATIDCWRVNYGLDKRTPAQAAKWWSDRLGGFAPSGCVAALGIALDELEALRAAQQEPKAVSRPHIMNDTPKPKLTPWFPGSVDPMRPGVYECDWRECNWLGGRWYCRWDGKAWHYGTYYPIKRHMAKIPPHRADSALKRWRGLAQDPKG